MLYNNAANCCEYIASEIDEWMSTEYWQNDTKKGNCSAQIKSAPLPLGPPQIL